jgi:pyruvate/2-oxoglutarate dehydrogenase complex dihydrolipoamide acyltransferase (E2) component
MKVTSGGPANALGAVRSAGRPAASEFEPAMEAAEETAAPAATTRTTALGAVNSLDALLALQETLTPTERRRRAVRRAGKILDALDGLKLSLLGGDTTEADLQSLQAAVQEARAETQDPDLEALLEQVETRAAVELAKREMIEAGMRRRDV